MLCCLVKGLDFQLDSEEKKLRHFPIFVALTYICTYLVSISGLILVGLSLALYLLKGNKIPTVGTYRFHRTMYTIVTV
jgi:hypothetical protein